MASTKIRPCSRGASLGRLNPNQRLFIEHLLADPMFNPTSAARAAGYKNPPQAANKLLNNRAVAAYVGKEIQQRISECKFEAAQVLEHLATVLFLDPLELFEKDGNGIFQIKSLEDVPSHLRRCIKKIKCRTQSDDDGNTETCVDIELMDKDQAMSLAMRHFGLLDARGAGPGPNGQVNVSVNVLGNLLDRVEREGNSVIDAEFIADKSNE